MKPLAFIQYAWVVEAACLVAATVVLAFGWPDRLPDWTAALPVIGGVIAAQGGAAFGGPAIKRAQGAKAATADPMVNDGR